MSLLPKDLQRFSIDGPHVVPQYIKATPSVVQVSEQILDCFRFCSDGIYGDLVSALEPLCMQSQRHRLIRGLIHILEQRLVFDESVDVEPLTLREALFKKAAKIGGAEFCGMEWRQRIVEEVASEFHLKPEQIEQGFYADLKDERRIVSFEDLDTGELIAEYNLALAKSLLLYASKLTFTVDVGEASAQSIRRLFKSLRFFNLLFDAEALTNNVWQFTVDGPTSVLPQPQKYASSLAAFLPTLYEFATWFASSSIKIDGKMYDWQLKPDDFSAPEIKIGQRVPEEAQQLAARIPQIDAQWEITQDYPILNFGQQMVWIPDFSIRHKDSGRVAHVEVMGFWRSDYLNRRLDVLKKAPRNLILVLSDKLKVDTGALHSTGIQMVTFKRTPRPQDVIKAALECAV